MSILLQSSIRFLLLHVSSFLLFCEFELVKDNSLMSSSIVVPNSAHCEPDFWRFLTMRPILRVQPFLVYLVCMYTSCFVLVFRLQQLFLNELNRVILRSMGVFVGNRYPMISHLLFCKKKSKILFPLVVYAWRQCLNLNDQQPIWFIEGKTHFSTSWHARLSLTSNEPLQNVLQSILHTTSDRASQNLPNMEGVVCKTTSSQPKVPSDRSIALLKLVKHYVNSCLQYTYANTFP